MSDFLLDVCVSPVLSWGMRTLRGLCVAFQVGVRVLLGCFSEVQGLVWSVASSGRRAAGPTSTSEGLGLGAEIRARRGPRAQAPFHRGCSAGPQEDSTLHTLQGLLGPGLSPGSPPPPAWTHFYPKAPC